MQGQISGCLGAGREGMWRGRRNPWGWCDWILEMTFHRWGHPEQWQDAHFPSLTLVSLSSVAKQGRGTGVLLIGSLFSIAHGCSLSTSSLRCPFVVRSPQSWEPLYFGVLPCGLQKAGLLTLSLKASAPGRIPLRLLALCHVLPLSHPFPRDLWGDQRPATLLAPPDPGKARALGYPILEVQAVFTPALLTCQPPALSPSQQHPYVPGDNTQQILRIWLGRTMISIII